ncbi:MAG: hypothetical protein QXJ95_02990 [Ignisphaera sp.]
MAGSIPQHYLHRVIAGLGKELEQLAKNTPRCIDGYRRHGFVPIATTVTAPPPYVITRVI